MKKIYLDSDFKCHIINDGAMMEVETALFDGKCDNYIEGFRLIPEGQVWIGNDGTVFQGMMFAPWKDFCELDANQRAYEL